MNTLSTLSLLALQAVAMAYAANDTESGFGVELSMNAHCPSNLYGKCVFKHNYNADNTVVDFVGDKYYYSELDYSAKKHMYKKSYTDPETNEEVTLLEVKPKFKGNKVKSLVYTHKEHGSKISVEELSASEYCQKKQLRTDERLNHQKDPDGTIKLKSEGKAIGTVSYYCGSHEYFDEIVFDINEKEACLRKHEHTHFYGYCSRSHKDRCDQIDACNQEKIHARVGETFRNSCGDKYKVVEKSGVCSAVKICDQVTTKCEKETVYKNKVVDSTFKDKCGVKVKVTESCKTVRLFK